MLSDILSVISLCLLHETPFNAIWLHICAICSNITELGSWKNSQPWNGFCISDYRRVLLYASPITEKVVEIKIAQITHTKFPFETVFLGG